MICFSILNIPFFQYLCNISNVGDMSFVSANDITFVWIGSFFFYEFFEKFYFFFEVDFFVFFYDFTLHHWFFFFLYSCFFFQFFDFDSNFSELEMFNFLFQIRFFSECEDRFLSFFPIQEVLFICTDETYLTFFRIHNHFSSGVRAISIYIIYPPEITAYLYKLQCFCFDEIFLTAFEVVDLPLIFFISSDIFTSLFFNSSKIFSYKEIYLCYIIFRLNEVV